MKVVVVPYDSGWPQRYAAEAARIERALGDVLARLHHIGSTSVPGLSAKPVVDMLAEVHSLHDLDASTERMTVLGYQAMGEYGIPGRRYFRKDNANGEREFHVHAFVSSATDLDRHLAFRDYLRAHADVAIEYGNLKAGLARRFPDAMAAYVDGKDAFVKATETRALNWWTERGHQGGHHSDTPVIPVPPGARPASRVIVADERDRVLFLEASDGTPGTRWWVTPGGGLEPGESFPEAAVRELCEETGIITPVGNPVWTRHHAYASGGASFDLFEVFFFVRLVRAEVKPIAPDHYVTGHRWWTLAELAVSSDSFAPRRVAALLPDLLAGQLPSSPVDCGV